MGKPSIFSSRYEIEKRKRKKRRIITIFSVLILVIAAIIFFNINTGTKTNNKNNEAASNKNNTQQNGSPKTVAAKKEKAPKKKAQSKKTASKNYTASMPSGKQISVVYETSNNVNKITGILNADADMDYNINPSGSSIVLYQKSTQDMVIVNSDGTSSNISVASYTSQGGQNFDKATQLKNNPSYVWEASPKFIDDNNIAYISQLPWFNKQNKYIWKMNIKDKSNINTNITGTDVQIGNITPSGLQITSDNVTEYLKPDGSVSNQ